MRLLVITIWNRHTKKKSVLLLWECCRKIHIGGCGFPYLVLKVCPKWEDVAICDAKKWEQPLELLLTKYLQPKGQLCLVHVSYQWLWTSKEQHLSASNEADHLHYSILFLSLSVCHQFKLSLHFLLISSIHFLYLWFNHLANTPLFSHNLEVQRIIATVCWLSNSLIPKPPSFLGVIILDWALSSWDPLIIKL